MINEDTARRMAVRFFGGKGLLELAGKLEEDDWFCCDDILQFAVVTLGKVRAKKLYEMLPVRLWGYFLVSLEKPKVDEKLCLRINAIRHKFYRELYSPRPERLKRFPDYIHEMDIALQSYFRR